MAALVLGAGGFWYLTRDGDGSGGSNTAAAKDYDAAVEKVGVGEPAWTVTQGAAPEAIVVDAYWITDQHLVRRLPGRVVAYDLKSGDEAWTFELPGSDKVHCPSSQTPADNKVALLTSTDPAKSNVCGAVTVLDLGTGEQVSTTELLADQPRLVPSNGDTPVIFGQRLLIGGEASHVLDPDTGEPASVPGSYSACVPQSFGVFGELLIAQTDCETEDGDEVMRLRAFDANFGLVWEWENPMDENKKDQLPVLGVLSVEPLVVDVGHSGHQSQLVRVDVRTGKTTRFSEYDAGSVRSKDLRACNDTSLQSCHTSKVVDNKLVISTTPAQINPGTPEAAPGQQATEYRNELVAFDLESGEESWRTGKVDGRALALMVSAPDTLVALQPANPNGVKAMVVQIDPGAGDVTPVMPLGPRTHGNDDLIDHIRSRSFDNGNYRALYLDGRYLVFSTTHRAESQGDVDIAAFTLDGGS
ncbi:outer membrane protein assembly factor BamB family protein [Actinophytocola sediminis]